MRLEAPLFQRQYVWNRDQQGKPLSDDIERKFTEYLEGRKDAPVHFLGANGEAPLAAQVPLSNRFEECFQVLRNALQMVAIDLEHDNDAQVIFENA